MKEEHIEIRIATKRFTRFSVNGLRDKYVHVTWISVKIYWHNSGQFVRMSVKKNLAQFLLSRVDQSEKNLA